MLLIACSLQSTRKECYYRYSRRAGFGPRVLCVPASFSPSKERTAPKWIHTSGLYACDDAGVLLAAGQPRVLPATRAPEAKERGGEDGGHFYTRQLDPCHASWACKYVLLYVSLYSSEQFVALVILLCNVQFMAILILFKKISNRKKNILHEILFVSGHFKSACFRHYGLKINSC